MESLLSWRRCSLAVSDSFIIIICSDKIWVTELEFNSVNGNQYSLFSLQNKCYLTRQFQKPFFHN